MQRRAWRSARLFPCAAAGGAARFRRPPKPDRGPPPAACGLEPRTATHRLFFRALITLRPLSRPFPVLLFLCASLFFIRAELSHATSSPVDVKGEEAYGFGSRRAEKNYHAMVVGSPVSTMEYSNGESLHAAPRVQFRYPSPVLPIFGAHTALRLRFCTRADDMFLRLEEAPRRPRAATTAAAAPRRERSLPRPRTTAARSERTTRPSASRARTGRSAALSGARPATSRARAASRRARVRAASAAPPFFFLGRFPPHATPLTPYSRPSFVADRLRRRQYRPPDGRLLKSAMQFNRAYGAPLDLYNRMHTYTPAGSYEFSARALLTCSVACAYFAAAERRDGVRFGGSRRRRARGWDVHDTRDVVFLSCTMERVGYETLGFWMVVEKAVEREMAGKRGRQGASLERARRREGAVWKKLYCWR